MSKYGIKDAAGDTNVSNSHASGAWHQARDDARACGELTDRPSSGNNEYAKNEPTQSDYDSVKPDAILRRLRG